MHTHRLTRSYSHLDFVGFIISYKIQRTYTHANACSYTYAYIGMCILIYIYIYIYIYICMYVCIYAHSSGDVIILTSRGCGFNDHVW